MIKITTSNPQGLVDSINDAIVNGKIGTWLLDSDGDYTNNMDQWKDKAWMHVDLGDRNSSLVRFVIIESRTQKLSKSVYGVYHGRFAEMLLTYFDTMIDDMEVSPLLTKYDIVSQERNGL